MACQFLINKGHTILETNYRSGQGEIDIISRDGSILVFSEIKSRSGYAFGFPEEAVHQRKQQRLKQAAMAYLETGDSEQPIRFDVIAILLKPGQRTEIVHFEDAFY